MKYLIYLNSEKNENPTIVDSIFSAYEVISAAEPNKAFKIFAEETNILGDVIPGFVLYEAEKWDTKGLLDAFNLEISELYKEYDEFEFRNNWSLEDFYTNLLCGSEMRKVCFELSSKLGESLDVSDMELSDKCYNLIRAIELLYV